MKYLLLILSAISMITVSSYAQNPEAIIPVPSSIIVDQGFYELSDESVISIPDDKSFIHVGIFFSDEIGALLKNSPKLRIDKANINFIWVKDDALGNEGYRLKVKKDEISIESNNARGAFYATRTLMQLIYDQMDSPDKTYKSFRIPIMSVEDSPRFRYRGMHLDVCRHFMPVEFIKKYLDLMALHKQNYFHWHLTEDQGWRIEIKKYPLLTEIGSKRAESMIGQYKDKIYDGQPYGGFYTQEDIKEIVRYASDRYITVIPEIEMPGHSTAALAAYPQLGNNPDKIYKVATKWGVFEDIYMPREETFDFLKDVLLEVMQIFPGQYIHIGGDEVPKKQWLESRFVQNLMMENGFTHIDEVQSYFIKRIDTFVSNKGKKIIGWDEILEGGLSSNATVMSWRGTDGGIAAANMGHDVIMAPNSNCYLDHYQSDMKTQPIAFPAFLPLEKVYSFDPIPEQLPIDKHHHILGIQGNVWTEYMRHHRYVEYMVFPRAVAIAEIGWSDKKNLNYNSFLKRLEQHKKRLDLLDVNYFGAPVNDQFEYQWPKSKE